MNTIRAQLQHRLNPLHFYCRLRDLGFEETCAQKVSAFYERLFYRPVFC